MTIDSPASEQVSGLRRLWKEAFGDDDAYLDQFFSAAYSPERCRCIVKDGQTAAALYWFPCSWDGKPIAYLYAVATMKAFRHQGLALRLLSSTHDHLKALGYEGAILMPATQELFRLYEKAGYKTATSVREFSCKAAENPISLQSISPQSYAAQRSGFLPQGSVIQEGVTLDFLSTQASFYEGKGFLLCAALEDGKISVQEYLGDSKYAPGILAALGIPEGQFRGPGKGRPFTMYHSLTEDSMKTPTYFGLPMD